MYFKFECTSCGKSLKVREENAGKKARCPYCDASITVPRLSLEDVPVAKPRGSDDAPESEAFEPDYDAGPITVPITKKKFVEDQIDGTNVSLIRSAILGLGLTIIFFSALWPVAASEFGRKFVKLDPRTYELDPGWWVPVVLVYLTSWAVFMLWLKRRKLKSQKASMLFDVLPNELAEEITTRTVDRFVSHIRSLPVKPSESFLVNRVLRGLGHFKVRRSNPEVARMLTSQSEIDANAVDSSYAIIKVFIWAIPILGFIGTVIGIGAAVGGFSTEMSVETDVEALKDQLSVVTNGLGVAFDTTLIALVMSLLVSFPASAMQKAEEDLINWVDEYCNENLLRRLNDGDRIDVDAKSDMPTQIRQAIDMAMNGNHGAMVARIDELTEKVARLQVDQVDQLGGALNGLTERTETAQQEVASSMLETANSLQTYFEGLEKGLGSLNGVLEKLGEKKIIIEQHNEPKRGWSLFRRNGKK